MILPPKELITLDDCGNEEFHLQIYDSKLECQCCEYRGSYYIDGSEGSDSGKIGVCLDCIENGMCEMEIITKMVRTN